MNVDNDKKYSPNLLFDVLLSNGEKYFQETHFTKSIRSFTKVKFVYITFRRKSL